MSSQSPAGALDARLIRVGSGVVPLLSVSLNLPELLLIQTEMVPYFMPEDAIDGRAYLLHRTAAHFNWTLIDDDLVRRDQSVVVGAFRLRDAVVEAEEFYRRTHLGQSHRLLVRPVFDHHGDVVQSVSEELRKCIQCLGHKTGYIIAPNAKSVMGGLRGLGLFQSRRRLTFFTAERAEGAENDGKTIKSLRSRRSLR